MSVTTHSNGGKTMPNKATGKPDSEAKKAWMKNNSTMVTVKFMNKGDDDILRYLEGKQKATVIKKALRLLMAQEGFVYTPPADNEEQEGE